MMTEDLEYPIDGKGVFVVMKLCQHFFKKPWDKLSTLDYDTDKDSILETFNLTLYSPNLLYAENLTNENSSNNNFDRFMDTFSQQLEEKDEANKEPSFVMFVLMSHGLVNGGVLLSTPESEKNRVDPCDCEPHTGTGECYVRYISTHIMKKVCDVYGHLSIPKIFVIQTCRGDERGVILANGVDTRISRLNGVAPSELELFILNTSDCFLFRPCLEGHGSWAGVEGSKFGSFFIKHFCQALKQLRESANHSAENRKKLSGVRGSKDCPHPFERLLSLANEENMEGGWLVNICQRTTELVTNWLIHEIPESAKTEPTDDKQQPHFSSSLAYKVSFLKILKTQWEEKDQYLAEWYDKMQGTGRSTSAQSF
ncbi:uncharacterized protein [Watersipora subatra]|uniref:uncharacterized protein n=1 Tax=Watersipora subatra TaxID=2589382 RepID=UPI00355C9142